MKQTMVQSNGMKANFDDAGVARQIKRRDALAWVDASFLSGMATVRAVGHEGHVMPPGPKPPAAKPVEKVKPKAPQKAPAAKPPAKKAQSRLRAARSHRGRRCAPTTGVCGEASSMACSTGFTTPVRMNG